MILNQASNIMLGNQEVQKVYLGSQLVWERKKAPDITKIAIIKLDNNYQETSDIQYFDTILDTKNALDS
ncbi:MAG: hypothetical protein K2K06_00535, partial [Oscillospiraceae bacterium]|nr:hypothetical protein [Oscillospiraceae bacterium]